MTARDFIKLGFQHFAQRDYETAACYFQKAIEADRAFIAAYSALAETFNRMEKIDQAFDVVTKWLELDANDPLAHATLSRIYVQKGQIELAEKELAISNALSANRP